MISVVRDRNYPKRQEICVLYRFLSNEVPKGVRNGERNMIPGQSQAESFF